MFMNKANPFVRVLSVTWVVYALIAMAVSAPIIVSILANGYDLLGLPGWSWAFALCAWILVLVLHVRARISDPWRTNTTSETLGCLVSSASIVPVLYILGFLGYETMPDFQQHSVPEGGFPALDFALVTRDFAQLIAWISLTVIPCVAVLINISGIRMFKSSEKRLLVVVDTKQEPGHIEIFGSTRAGVSWSMSELQKSDEETSGKT